MKINKIYPNSFKHGSCLKEAKYVFTDYRKGRTIMLGYSCDDHVEDVRKLFNEIFKEGKENNLKQTNPKSEENKV